MPGLSHHLCLHIAFDTARESPPRLSSVSRAFSHFYERIYLSVRLFFRPSVRPSVRLSIRSSVNHRRINILGSAMYICIVFTTWCTENAT